MTNPPESANARPLRILVAEDVEINREILNDVLTGQGHELVFASHGAEAFELVQKQAFDLVLMDIQMPVMNGLEATRRIRELSGANGQVPILALTATTGAKERQSCLAAGMNGWLTKPFEWDRMEAALARYGTTPSGMEGAASPAEVSTVLVNAETLFQLGRRAGLAEVRDMVRTGIDAYESYCDAMLNPAASREDIQREAHKLKGSAGTFGLMKICDIAGRIEESAEGGAAIHQLVRALKETIGATRVAFIALGAVSQIPED